MDDPEKALEYLRARMETIAGEFASGKLNHAQFSAIYKHYGDKRTIIEKLMERDPETDAWRPVAAPGHTTFLRAHFEAHTLFYVVFRHHRPAPLITGGKQTPEATRQIIKLLKLMWGMQNRPTTGLARKAIGDGQWLVIATGVQAITFVLFSLQPSTLQINLVRDLHADFERANRILLERGVVSPERLVFPQRGLILPS